MHAKYRHSDDHKQMCVPSCVCMRLYVCVCVRKFEKVCLTTRRFAAAAVVGGVVATWEMGPRTGKGGCRLFFISPAAFQNSVVTLLESFQRVREEMPFSRTRECTAAYKTQRQRVYATGDDPNVSSPEKLDQEFHNNNVKPCNVCNLEPF